MRLLFWGQNGRSDSIGQILLSLNNFATSTEKRNETTNYFHIEWVYDICYFSKQEIELE
jgi:hypothetical protein